MFCCGTLVINSSMKYTVKCYIFYEIDDKSQACNCRFREFGKILKIEYVQNALKM